MRRSRVKRVWFIRVAIFFCKLPLILFLLCIFRGSLALFVWGRGKVSRWIARQYDADPGMYQRDRWKNTRKIVYARNKRENRGRFVCEATGKEITCLGDAHVDHILSRSGFPMLAYRIDNLRLTCEKFNIRKKDSLPILFFLKFAITNRIR